MRDVHETGSISLAGLSELRWTLGTTTKLATPTFGTTCPSAFHPVLGDVAVLGPLNVPLRTHATPALSGAIVATDATVTHPNGGGVTSGETYGDFSPSADGAATYRVPISVTPGRLEMQPSLSLAYSSGANANGPLGVGWQLGGLSRITRCKKTIASDGFNQAIAHDGADRYCLDGDYLVSIGGRGGQSEEYRPEHDPFTKVVANGVSTAGPSTFTVTRRNGTVQRYGVGTSRTVGVIETWSAGAASTADPVRTAAEGIHAWNLGDVEDSFGNGLYFVYGDPDTGCAPPACVGTQHLIKSIHY